MKHVTHWILIAILAASSCLVCGGTAQAVAVPDYEGEFFTDLTDQIPVRDSVQISRRLRVAHGTSGIHPMLVVMQKMADYPELPQQIDAMATTLAKEWKIGDADTKKGLLILFALDDRKFFVAKTGNLPQSVADDIKEAIGRRVRDSLRANKVSTAMTQAASAIAEQLPAKAKKATPVAAAHGSSHGPQKTTTRTTTTRRSHSPTHSVRHRGGHSIGGGLVGLICPLVVIGIIVMSVISMFTGRSHGYGGGYGGYGGGGGGFLSGMATGGLLGYMFGGGHHGWGGGHYGGYHGHGGNDFTETTTTESWTDGGGFGGGDFGGGFDGGGGFDTFGGGDFDGGGSFGEW